ncbi:histidine phosphatase family protein [Cystobacter fuscus]
MTEPLAQRFERACTLLGRGGLRLLGAGGEGVVVTDGESVFKVFDGWPEPERARRAEHLACFVGRFEDCRTLVTLRALEQHSGLPVLRYDYVPSGPWEGEHTEDLLTFLSECWQQGIVYQCVNPSNFRLFSRGLRLIDYGSDLQPFTLKDWVFMARRAFLSLRLARREDLKALLRTALREWELPELEGFPAFLEQALRRVEGPPGEEPSRAMGQLVARARSAPVQLTGEWSGEENEALQRLAATLVHEDARAEVTMPWGRERPDLVRARRALLRAGLGVEEHEVQVDAPGDAGEPSGRVRWTVARGTQEPLDVSLVLKASFLEGRTLEHQLRHLLVQLEGPRVFNERLVVLDTREDGFVRQYGPAAPEAAWAALERLRTEGWVDRVLVAPTEEPSVRATNARWFGVDTPETHALSGVPVAPQLFAFEQASGPYVLQVDSDAIICRRDWRHDYPADMVAALRAAPSVVSVGFNIAHASPRFVPYTSPGEGHFVPEVRCCLFERERLLALRPLPNHLEEGRLALTWYRSVQEAQRQRGLRSVRGGDGRTFYIHPPNSRKPDTAGWFDIVDRVAQGYVPAIQHEQVELQGTERQWALPALHQEHLFLVLVERHDASLFPRCWRSLLEQSRRDWGALILDASGEQFVQSVLEPERERVTLVRNALGGQGTEAARKALDRYWREPHGVLVPLRAGDVLLGAEVLTVLRRRFVAGYEEVEAPVLVRGRLEHQGVAFRRWLMEDEGSRHERDRVETPLVARGQPLDWPPRAARAAGASENEEPGPTLLPAGRLVQRLRQRGPERYLLFVRHAEKEVGSRFEPLESNRVRPLSWPGEDECTHFARALAVPPELVLCGPLERAVQTARGVREALRERAELRVLEPLSGGRFEDHVRWQELKRELGWEELVRRWIDGGLPPGIVAPYEQAVRNMKMALGRHSARPAPRGCWW